MATTPATEEARRLKEEMGFVTPLEKVFDFVYQASFDNGLTEHEFDHVFIGYYDGPIQFDPEEVNSYVYRTMDSIQYSIESNDGLFTAWFEIIFPKMMQWWKLNYAHKIA